MSRNRSLTRTILLGTALVTLVGLLVCGAILYGMYVGADTRVRETTLQGEARRVAIYLRDAPPAPDARIALPQALVRSDRSVPVQCVVVDAAGRIIAALGRQDAPLWPPGGAKPQAFFHRQDPASGERQYGISQRVDLPGGAVWVQIATPADSDMLYDSLLEEFVLDFGWLLLPFGLLVLVTNGWLIRRDLAPLHEASAQAAAIGHGTPGMRLPEREVPREILPLVQAMNGALDRIEDAAERQRCFIADVAHELRTPLAVMRLQLDLLPDRGIAAPLLEDVQGMERMVGQLLDLARLDGLRLEAAGLVDLNLVAADVVQHLALLAIRRGRSFELDLAPGPALARGGQDPLFRALRNLAENALAHAPPGSAIGVQVTDEPAVLVSDHGPGIPAADRGRIFDRHWQRQRDRDGGAGLGLAIVARTAEAHAARLTVDDAPGGGALIGLHFPSIIPKSEQNGSNGNAGATAA